VKGEERELGKMSTVWKT